MAGAARQEPRWETAKQTERIMGLFSDTCEALIDVATKRALQGDALVRARQNPDAPRCGNRVPKAARFCNRCGSSAPGGWWRCPHCRKWWERRPTTAGTARGRCTRSRGRRWRAASGSGSRYVLRGGSRWRRCAGCLRRDCTLRLAPSHSLSRAGRSRLCWGRGGTRWRRWGGNWWGCLPRRRRRR